MIDLFNREIIGVSVGWHKTAELVKQAIQSIPYALTKVNLFHSLEELILKTKDYVHWWNHHRIHGSLGYQTPMAKRIIA